MGKNQFSLALVTGASSGIGEALAKLLATKGINLILTGRNEARLKALELELTAQVNVRIVTADLSLPEGRRKVIESIHQLAPDLVINNAGLGLYGEILTFETKDSMQVMEVDGMAVLELTIEAARTLVSKQSKGVILNVSSSAGFQIFPLFAVYASAKAFVTHFSESFDEEMQSKGIRILAACPGVIETNFQKRAGGKAGDMQNVMMSAEYAAEQIWQQIVNKKKVNIFNWPYKILTFLSKYLLPRKLTVFVLRRAMEKRLGDNRKEIIKIHHD
jgi:short-subunit dehydrogenase